MTSKEVLSETEGSVAAWRPSFGAWLRRLNALEHAHALPSWLFAFWCALLVVRVHLPYIAQPSEQSVDEGYLIAIGQLMLNGRMLPFVDGVAHSGPVFLYSGALLAAFDPFSYLPTRIAAAGCFAAISLLLFACARRAGLLVGAAAAAAGVPLIATLRMPPFDAIAYNAELPAVIFTLASFYYCIRGVGARERPVSMGALAAAGVLTALAALSKQIAALLVLPLGFYVLVNVLARDELPLRERGRLVLVYAGAVFTPVALLFTHYAVTGALSDVYYYLVSYNSGPYMYPFRDLPLSVYYRDWIVRRPLEVGLLFTAVVCGLGPVFAARASERTWLHALRAASFSVTVALMAIGGVVGARASMRDFIEHYWVMTIPGFSLLAGFIFERAVGTFRQPRFQVALQVFALAPLLFVGELVWTMRKDLPPAAWSTQHMRIVDVATASVEPPVCQFIRENSAPHERIFVWGFRPELYVECERLPGTRFVFTTFNSGVVPFGNQPKEIEDTLAVPGSRELLIADLERTKPRVIVDSARTLEGRSFRRYELLAQYVEQHYRPAGAVGGDEVWLRR